jgi:hypothetical protein
MEMHTILHLMWCGTCCVKTRPRASCSAIVPRLAPQRPRTLPTRAFIKCGFCAETSGRRMFRMRLRKHLESNENLTLSPNARGSAGSARLGICSCDRGHVRPCISILLRIRRLLFEQVRPPNPTMRGRSQLKNFARQCITHVQS